MNIQGWFLNLANMHLLRKSLAGIGRVFLPMHNTCAT